jgi:hypothetical protein
MEENNKLDTGILKGSGSMNERISNGLTEVLDKVNFSKDRATHVGFFRDRDWERVGDYWSHLIKEKYMPDFVRGDRLYGITDLSKLHFDASYEFGPNNPKGKRKTFAFIIGYDGSKYSGFQKQANSTVATVESDIEEAFSRKVSAAGRTDKDVSAMSQVISFSTFDDITIEEICDKTRQSRPFLENKLVIWDALRLPRKFHPLFCATWRRYVFLFPLNKGSFYHGVDVDIEFVNECFLRYH